MLSFEPELERLRPLLPVPTTDALIARERREVFSVQPEVRICAWAGAMLLAMAVGIVLKNNLERIGPLALAAMIGAAAIACYAFVWTRRARPSIVDDYILLLGALLVSADVAFIETQFHLFGDHWYRHFALLAILHGVTAYLYNSRTLLTLAVVAMCSWMGVQQAPFPSMNDVVETSLRLLACLALVLMWRFANRREEFHPVLEHFAFNLLVLTPFALTFDEGLRTAGCLLTLIAAGAVIYLGFRLRRESNVLYGFVYGVIAFDVLLIDLVDSDLFSLFLVVVSMIGAIAALFAIHARFQEQSA
ncbi:MAG TPA: DUF2157 domain-containing protein [Thermoanaerobaculia bacterium]|nr:DUF2157 domain-containing protein [Thermoanaerobaculia bacterium]